jgi:hypothetical protein
MCGSKLGEEVISRQRKLLGSLLLGQERSVVPSMWSCIYVCILLAIEISCSLSLPDRFVTLGDWIIDRTDASCCLHLRLCQVQIESLAGVFLKVISLAALPSSRKGCIRKETSYRPTNNPLYSVTRFLMKRDFWIYHDISVDFRFLPHCNTRKQSRQMPHWRRPKPTLL